MDRTRTGGTGEIGDQTARSGVEWHWTNWSGPGSADLLPGLLLDYNHHRLQEQAGPVGIGSPPYCLHPSSTQEASNQGGLQ